MIKKRIISFLVCFCMVITLLPVMEVKATTTVSKIEITIGVPKKGEIPDTIGSVSDSANIYIKEVEWSGVLNYNGTYRGGTTYTARILVEIQGGADAAFSKVNTNLAATVNGNAAEWYRSSGGDNQIWVKYQFPKTTGTNGSSKKKVAISSESDLLKIRDNPEGSYYLKKDISIKTKNLQLFDGAGNGIAFSGTFDGKGHKIKNYTANVTSDSYEYVSLFGLVDKATFKNLTMSNVKITAKANHGGAFASLVSYGSAKYSKITVTGAIQVTGKETDGTESNGYGIAGVSASEGTFTNCTNKAKISANVTIESTEATSVSGIALRGTFKKCKNTANLSLSGHHGIYAGYGGIAGISIGGETRDTAAMSSSSKFTGCTNSGTIKQTGVKCKNYSNHASSYNAVAGITCSAGKVTDCHNTGKIISVDKSDYDSANAWVAGVAVGGGNKSSRCSNKGSVTVTTNYGQYYVGGVFTDVSNATQCYNTGKVTLKSKHGSDDGYVGGVFGASHNYVHECYNTGKVTTNRRNNTGGVTGEYSGLCKKGFYNCYNTGTVKGKKGTQMAGAILGDHDGAQVMRTHTVRDNYSTTKKKLYGLSSNSWKEWKAIGKKVSSITRSQCSTLTSKYWTYSKTKKRLILKNNKEK